MHVQHKQSEACGCGFRLYLQGGLPCSWMMIAGSHNVKRHQESTKRAHVLRIFGTVQEIRSGTSGGIRLADFTQDSHHAPCSDLASVQHHTARRRIVPCGQVGHRHLEATFDKSSPSARRCRWQSSLKHAFTILMPLLHFRHLRLCLFLTILLIFNMIRFASSPWQH